MSEKEIVQGPLGSVGKYDVSFSGGKLVATVSAAEGPAGINVSLVLDAGQVLDAIAKAIPGTFDDAIISVAKAALLGA